MSDTVIVEKPIEKPQIVKKERYKPIKKLTANHQAVKALLQNSTLTSTQISHQTGYHPVYIRELKKKLLNTTILTEKIKRLAKKRLTEILQLEPMKQEIVIKEKTSQGFIEKIVEFKDYPSHANVLEAINTVVDRSEPKINKVEADITLNLGEILAEAIERKRKIIDVSGGIENA